MQGIPKDDDWKFFTQLMYDTINTLADNPEQIVRTLRAHEAQVQMDDDLEVVAMSSKLQTKSEKRNAKQTWKSRKSHDCHSESDGSCSESEKHRLWHTQECYRCQKVGHIAQYCPGTAPVENGALTATSAITMATTSVENYWMTVMNEENPSKESWNSDCATTTQLWGDW
jgi:hypothetical protein